MTEDVHFIADAALIDRIGRELVGRQETALIELVKNAYDADATEVKVTLDEAALLIDDNGTGMSRDELTAGFLRLASNLKVKEPRSRRYQRQRAGRKGIGRFATQRLGSRLCLKTWTDGSEAGLELNVDWNQFKVGRRLDEVTAQLAEIPPRHPGTILRIEGLRDEWTEAQIRRCWRGVVNLQQPFPVAPVTARPMADPGFNVTLLRAGGIFSDRELVVDLQTEILDHLHAVIEFRVGDTGNAEWRLSRNSFGPDRNWSPIHDEHRDSATPPPYESLRNVWMKAFYFILLPELLPSLVYTRIRDILRNQGGIRLYRNGFRVVPYGSVGDDWLSLDDVYSRRGNVLAPIANRNFFGVIEVHDPEGIDFEEHTSREGLIETAALTELRALASSVLATAVIRIAEDRGRKTRAGGSRVIPSDTALEKIREAERRAREAAARKDAAGAGQARDGQGTSREEEAANLLKAGGDAIAAREAELADEAVLLRLLATLGLTAAEFSHETGMTFEAVRISFQRVFDVACVAKAADPGFLEEADRARSMINRLDALTGYLNEVASARSVREMAPISVSRAIDDFAHGMKQHAEKSEIEIDVDIPPLDPLYTRPMHQAEVASVLLNFYSNSIKAMRRADQARKILVEGRRESDGAIVIGFSDTGDGIASENSEKVFDLFFTTRAAARANAHPNEQITGTGLGLWIVYQIVSKAGGDVEVVEPPEGYSTRLEVRLPAEEENE